MKNDSLQKRIEKWFDNDQHHQGGEGATVGTLADGLAQSRAWYFWWD